MRLCLVICAGLLAACGPDPAPHPVSLLDLAPCAGWQGTRPVTEGQFARAAAAERSGRLCANNKLAAVNEIVNEE